MLITGSMQRWCPLSQAMSSGDKLDLSTMFGSEPYFSNVATQL